MRKDLFGSTQETAPNEQRLIGEGILSGETKELSYPYFPVVIRAALEGYELMKLKSYTYKDVIHPNEIINLKPSQLPAPYAYLVKVYGGGGLNDVVYQPLEQMDTVGTSLEGYRSKETQLY